MQVVKRTVARPIDEVVKDDTNILTVERLVKFHTSEETREASIASAGLEKSMSAQECVVDLLGVRAEDGNF